MKKLLSISLAVLLLFAVMSFAVSAKTTLGPNEKALIEAFEKLSNGDSSMKEKYSAKIENYLLSLDDADITVAQLNTLIGLIDEVQDVFDKETDGKDITAFKSANKEKIKKLTEEALAEFDLVLDLDITTKDIVIKNSDGEIVDAINYEGGLLQTGSSNSVTFVVIVLSVMFMLSTAYVVTRKVTA